MNGLARLLAHRRNAGQLEAARTAGRVAPAAGRAGDATSRDRLWRARPRLFETIAQVVSRLAAREPLLFVLEDVHWADELTVRLLAFLRRFISTGQVEPGEPAKPATSTILDAPR